MINQLCKPNVLGYETVRLFSNYVLNDAKPSSRVSKISEKFMEMIDMDDGRVLSNHIIDSLFSLFFECEITKV